MVANIGQAAKTTGTGPAPRACSGFLTVSDAAAELEVSELAVKRLVARQRIKAVQLGQDGPLRIAAAELARYMGTNAPDLQMPDLSGSYFSDASTRIGFGQFEGAMQPLVTASLPTMAPADTRPNWQQSAALEVELRVTPAMLAAARKPIDFSFAPPSDEAPEWVDMAHAYFTQELRDIMGAMLPSIKPRLETLYASPEAYSNLLGLATDKLKAKSFFRNATLPAADGNGMKLVRFMVRYAGFLDQGRLLSVWQSAF